MNSRGVDLLTGEVRYDDWYAVLSVGGQLGPHSLAALRLPHVVALLPQLHRHMLGYVLDEEAEWEKYEAGDVTTQPRKINQSSELRLLHLQILVNTV